MMMDDDGTGGPGAPGENWATSPLRPGENRRALPLAGLAGRGARIAPPGINQTGRLIYTAPGIWYNGEGRLQYLRPTWCGRADTSVAPGQIVEFAGCGSNATQVRQGPGVCLPLPPFPPTMRVLGNTRLILVQKPDSAL